MQRQRGELVPIGEALADLGGPIQALRETPPLARRGFTHVQGSARKDVVFGAARVYTFTAPGPKWKSWLNLQRSLGHPPCWSNVVVPYHIF